MLTEQLTADAAALHQAILAHGGEVSPFFCGKELGWEHRRIARAMDKGAWLQAETARSQARLQARCAMGQPVTPW